MMTLMLNSNNIDTINKINAFCLVRGIDARCQYSKMTGNVIYAFSDDYPKGLEGEGVTYNEIK